MGDYRTIHDPNVIDSDVLRNFRNRTECGLIDARKKILTEYRDAALQQLQDNLHNAGPSLVRDVLHDVLELMRSDLRP